MDETDFTFLNKKKSQSKHATDAANEKNYENLLQSLPEKIERITLSRPALEDTYDTSNPRLGIAVILNHKTIKGQMLRLGTEKDRDRISNSLRSYGFDVRVYNDMTCEEIKKELMKTAEEDHGKNDCFVLVVMSHGIPGEIYAKDISYPVECLWKPFLGENCKSLINKPKLFFIQGCRGENLEKPVFYKSAIRKLSSLAAAPEEIIYAIPNSADMLVMYSTFDNSYSFRNVENGSWFIQSLCSVLDQASESADARTEGSELLKLLTAVNRKVAYEYHSNAKLEALNKMKQMPNFMSTLTKTFYLKDKEKEEGNSKEKRKIKEGEEEGKHQ